MLGTLGTATTIGTAGCGGLLGESGGLNLWVKNDMDSERAYEVSVDSATESGTLDAGELDLYEDIVDNSDTGETVSVSVEFGIGSPDDMATVYEGSDDLQVGDDSEAVVARVTEMGGFYGLTDNPGDDTDSEE